MEHGFEERKKKQEDKWALDAELRFKATARRNKLLGRWAAGQMGLTAAAADEYAKAVVAAAMHGADGDPALRKVRDDLCAAGVRPSDEDFQAKVTELTELARQQVLKGQK